MKLQLKSNYIPGKKNSNSYFISDREFNVLMVVALILNNLIKIYALNVALSSTKYLNSEPIMTKCKHKHKLDFRN